MTTHSLFWFVVFAGIGGVFVTIGLLMEQSAEKNTFKHVGQFRFCKKIKFWGEWLVILGVFVEVIVAGVTATNEWGNRPENKEISDLSVLVDIDMKGKDFNPLPTDMDSPAAYLELCETNMQPLINNGSIVLVANANDITRSSVMGFTNIVAYSYAMNFHSSAYFISSPSFFNGKPASEVMDKVNTLAVLMYFMPVGKKVMLAQAEMNINGGALHKHFYGNSDSTCGYALSNVGITAFWKGPNTNASIVFIGDDPNASKNEPVPMSLSSLLAVYIAYGTIFAGILWMCFGWIFYQRPFNVTSP